MKRINLRLAAAGLLAASSIHCAAANDASTDDESTATVEESVVAATYCWAQIERPLPSDAVLPIGTPLSLRANPNLNCPPGVNDTLVYRFYVEGPAGKFSPEGPTEWSSSRVVPFDTTQLTPGRYRIYVYSLPDFLVGAWVAGDPTARAAAHRSGYTYVTFESTHWQTGSWGDCSMTCGAGSESRTANCVDQDGISYGDSMCLASKPATSQWCMGTNCSADTLGVDGVASAVSASGRSASWNGSTYWTIGNGGESSPPYYFEVDFAMKPTTEATYSSVDDGLTWPLGASQATVWIFTADSDWWTQLGSAPINVVRETDGNLHVVFQDPALRGWDGTTLAVSLDVTLP